MPRIHLTANTRTSLNVVLIALASDITVAAVKFIAAHYSGSTSMASEGIHSLIDASTEIILLYGLLASDRKATPDHQLGYGRELYFWNFVVALLIFAVGSGIAFREGTRQISTPLALHSMGLSYAVLAFSAVAEAMALWVALRKSNASRGKVSLYRFFARRRDPTALTILFGGIAALIGLVVTAVGLMASGLTENARYDGIASVAISAVLAVTAFKLAAESKSLLIGVPAAPDVVKEIIDGIKVVPSVRNVNGMISVHLAPDKIMVATSVSFDENMTTKELENAIADIEESLHNAHPQIVALFVKPQSPERYAELFSEGPLPRYGRFVKVSATPYASV